MAPTKNTLRPNMKQLDLTKKSNGVHKKQPVSQGRIKFGRESTSKNSTSATTVHFSRGGVRVETRTNKNGSNTLIVNIEGSTLKNTTDGEIKGLKIIDGSDSLRITCEDPELSMKIDSRNQLRANLCYGV